MIGVTVAFANDQHAGGSYYGSEGIFFYLVAYALMTLGAFGVIIALRHGPAGRDGRRPRGPGLDPSLVGARDGDLPVQPGRHSRRWPASGASSRSSPRCWPRASVLNRARSWCWRSSAC